MHRLNVVRTTCVTAYGVYTQYRAEFLVFMLAGATPLIMMFVWISIARTGATGEADATWFAAYFLLVYGTRQMSPIWLIRELDEERDTAALTGTQKRKRAVRLYLSNLSGEKRTVEVQERIPVSEIEGLEVICNDAAWKFDGDGIGRRTVELAAGAHEKLTLRYELRASSNVVLP